MPQRGLIHGHCHLTSRLLRGPERGRAILGTPAPHRGPESGQRGERRQPAARASRAFTQVTALPGRISTSPRHFAHGRPPPPARAAAPTHPPGRGREAPASTAVPATTRGATWRGGRRPGPPPGPKGNRCTAMRIALPAGGRPGEDSPERGHRPHAAILAAGSRRGRHLGAGRTVPGLWPPPCFRGSLGIQRQIFPIIPNFPEPQVLGGVPAETRSPPSRASRGLGAGRTRRRACASFPGQKGPKALLPGPIVMQIFKAPPFPMLSYLGLLDDTQDSSEV